MSPPVFGDKELGDPAFPSRSATAAGQRLSCDIRRSGAKSRSVDVSSEPHPNVQFCTALGLAAPIGSASLGEIIWPARGHLTVARLLAERC
jgi:hypothetical protein